MSNIKKYDLIVIGSGPGGYIAAIRASQLKFKTAIIEREDLGGVCLNWGCIPTKSLLRSAEIYHYLKHADSFGLSVEKPGFDFKKIILRSRSIAQKLSQGVSYLMKKNKIDVIKGNAKLKKSAKGVNILVEKDQKTNQYQADHIILATGARARTFKGLEPDGQSIWTYREALTPKALPSSLLVIGSGAIGSEFASFYSDLGVKTTLIEAQNRILPSEDHEVSAFVEKSFKRSGIQVLKETKIQKIETKQNNEVHVYFEGEKKTSHSMKAEKAILALGVTGNIENLGLEDLNVKTDKGSILIDSVCRTNINGIYAIGDVADAPWLAHKASHEALICVEAIANQKPHPLNKNLIPGCTYCRPQIASIGLTEHQALEKGFKIRIGRFPLSANGKAIALGETEGFTKTIIDQKTGEILGAHMVGSEVTELIQGYVTAISAELTDLDLLNTIYAHPTLSESMHESVLDAHQRALNI